MYTLSSKEHAFFSENGYLSIKDAVDETALAELRSLCRQFMQNRGIDERTLAGERDGQLPLVWIRCSNEELEHFARTSALFRWARRWASELLQVDEQSLRPKLRVFYKRPFSESAVEWHQDEAFYQKFSGERPDGYRSLNCWVALDDAAPESGTLKYIPGSHRDGLVEHDVIPTATFEPLLKGESRDNDEQAGITLRTTSLDESRAIYASVPRGGINIHHCRTLHASDANTCASPRGAFVMIFRQEGGPGTSGQQGA